MNHGMSRRWNILQSVAFFALLLPINTFAHELSPEYLNAPEMAELRLIDRADGTAPQWMTLAEAMSFGAIAHQAGRCAGFMDITDHTDGTDLGLRPDQWPMLGEAQSFALNLAERPMSQALYLQSALGMLEASRVDALVTQLSGFQNRYYKSDTGVEAANWIAQQFKSIAQGRADVSVQQVKHDWAQPSVIATIEGQGKNKNEIVIIGGHEDSINQSAFGSRKMKAPGADDNASGIASVLEVFRVLVQSGFKTDRTLMFMAYAGEEVGLLGSQDIANQFKKDKRAVVAVMQLDMTGFAGAGKQIVFMSDFVNADLTRFTQKLLDTYVKTTWSVDKCGYACSDHASWTKAGYSAVMPFEATFSGMNHDIHTVRDTKEILDFDHALTFVQLGLAFMAELAIN
jgi:leucyl aminopeptidase